MQFELLAQEKWFSQEFPFQTSLNKQKRSSSSYPAKIIIHRHNCQASTSSYALENNNLNFYFWFPFISFEK